MNNNIDIDSTLENHIESFIEARQVRNYKTMKAELDWLVDNGYEKRAEHFDSTLDPNEVAEISVFNFECPA